jgi:hypothetical protein
MESETLLDIPTLLSGTLPLKRSYTLRALSVTLINYLCISVL